jgi:uncharacterized protein
MVPRVLLTEKAAELIARLKAQHGPLMFHQSGGCCDGSTPMCFAAGEFRVGAQDVLMGEIAGCNFYIGANQFEYWRHTQLIIDVVPGRGAGFMLEAPEGPASALAQAPWTAFQSTGRPAPRSALRRGQCDWHISASRLECGNDDL